MLLSIIIPTYNEEKTITKVLENVLAVELPLNIHKQIIIVDDASLDNTEKIISGYQKPEIALIYEKHAKNRGKGAAIRTGIKLATGDFVLFQDADLEYNPADYPKLLEPLLANEADVVYGSRFLKNRQRKSPLFYIGNLLLTKLTNLFTGFKLTDMETCYKVFRRNILNDLELKEDGFGIEPEITCKLAKLLNIRLVEVPITYSARSHTDGKKIKYRDGLKAAFCILKYGLVNEILILL